MLPELSELIESRLRGRLLLCSSVTSWPWTWQNLRKEWSVGTEVARSSADRPTAELLRLIPPNEAGFVGMGESVLRVVGIGLREARLLREEAVAVLRLGDRDRAEFREGVTVGWAIVDISSLQF